MPYDYAEQEAIGLLKGHLERLKARDKLSRQLASAFTVNGGNVERYVALSKKINLVENTLKAVLKDDERAPEVKEYIFFNISNSKDFPAYKCPWDKSGRTFTRRREEVIKEIAKNFR